MYAPPPAPQPSRGPSTALVIVLVLCGVLAVGGGGCLVCLGVGTYVGLKADPASSAPAPVVPSTPPPPPPVATPDTPPVHLPDLRPTSTPTPKAPPKPAAPAKGPRVVDFVCPPGQAPQGVVRAGCLCGSEILGTACGTAGGFVDVQPTARGCRFTCP